MNVADVESKALWLQYEMNFVWINSLRAFVNPELESKYGDMDHPKWPVIPEALHLRISYGTFQLAILKLVKRARKRKAAPRSR